MSELPVWITFLLVPVAMGLFALRYVMLLLREAGGERTGSRDFHETGREAGE